MKITVEIADPLFRAAKREASKRGTTFREVIESALRLLLDAAQGDKRRFTLRKHTFRGEGLKEGIREGDWTRLRDMIYRS
ncbi:MAG: hypothetical protein ABSF77_12765 [Spirochaetia bacterium]|jgi:hypothetical protein